MISDAKGKAEILNKQFDQAFSEGKVYDKESIKEKCSLDAKEYPSMPNITFTVEGIFKLLKGLNPSKAPGPDGITPRVLKELAFEIAPSLALIFQRSYDSGIVPSCWKIANVSPVYKKGEHYNPGNYRLISLTSIPCKVMEHIVVSNMMNHLERNQILTPFQHGFRARHSCVSQLTQLTDEMTKKP